MLPRRDAGGPRDIFARPQEAPERRPELRGAGVTRGPHAQVFASFAAGIKCPVRRATSLLGWFAVLEGLWAVLVGTTQSTELVAGLVAAAAGAIFAELLRSQGLFGFSPDWALVAKAWRLPWLVVFDFALVTWTLISSLARGRSVRGTWVTVPFPTAAGPNGRWQRAFAVATSNGAANALVVELSDNQARLHALEPKAFSAKSVL
jgi:hypothetical protein